MNEQTKAIIKSTAPILKKHGEEITQTMYKILFTMHPEAQALFKNASADQYKKLALMVYAYAANIDNLGSLQKGIDNVAHIHVNTQVLPEHYPWVGEALLTAIKEVLAEAATDEVLNAWEEAYGFLAKVFITREEEIYTKA
ncbi:MAG: Flavohemoprotein (Hemoglobin-like protein) (Flavohemoglobin) (Nitric oxide dioxygenase) (EC [uncultured Sulfurovum sp.]|uniref:Flavohemoprotein (Hemoglobin-like protein) (Flavohemoglobin) (Nitric oxide dioxygenase) (EC) n=1 Tax=uncultured Sulfurovum sp. TaxID=269237 RepID=A0A6S6RZ22_9BACT|nr:MAG: Flavohemoprotein (Hemoglobin-like protein) (Flavohemoglobin) (Nitric oxide dioxygenase) (EC [uncultured Sulfurovum sp.]